MPFTRLQWFEFELKIKFRIACEEIGYPSSESLYSSISDYELKTGQNFSKLLEEYVTCQ